MAACCSLEYGKLNTNTCSKTWDFQRIYSHKVSRDIDYDGIRISWHNDYESLQKFMKFVFVQQGKWKSAGGTSKKFVSSTADLSCTWYPGKLNSLLFHGNVGNLVKEVLVAVCKSTSFNNFENNVRDCVHNIAELDDQDTYGMPNLLHTPTSDASCSAGKDICPPQLNPKYIDVSSQTDAHNKEQCSCEDLLYEIDNMKINFEILLSRIDALQSLANSQAICFKNEDIVHLETELTEERSKNIKLESTVSLLTMEKSCEIESLKSKVNSLDIKLDKCIKDYETSTTQSPIVLPQSPIVPPQVPILFPYSPNAPSKKLNKRSQDQTSKSGLQNCKDPRSATPKKANHQRNNKVFIPGLTNPGKDNSEKRNVSRRVSPSPQPDFIDIEIQCHPKSYQFLNNLPLSDYRGSNCKQINNLNETSLLPQHVMISSESPELNNPQLHNNRSRKSLGKISHQNRDTYLSKSQPLESNNPQLLNNRSRKSQTKILHQNRGTHQSKILNRSDGIQPQRGISPFRKSPANYRPPRIVLEKQSMEWADHLKFVSQITHKHVKQN